MGLDPSMGIDTIGSTATIGIGELKRPRCNPAGFLCMTTAGDIALRAYSSNREHSAIRTVYPLWANEEKVTCQSSCFGLFLPSSLLVAPDIF
jgi:hypothetical protein